MFQAVLLLAAAIAAADGAADQATGDDLKRMQGDWMVASTTINEMKLPDDEAQTLFRTIKGESYAISRYSRLVGKGSFKIDASQSPRTIDSTPDGPAGKAGPIRGIYEFDGDRLKVCNAPQGKPRPTNFECKAGSGHTFIVWTPEKS